MYGAFDTSFAYFRVSYNEEINITAANFDV